MLEQSTFEIEAKDPDNAGHPFSLLSGSFMLDGNGRALVPLALASEAHLHPSFRLVHKEDEATIQAFLDGVTYTPEGKPYDVGDLVIARATEERIELWGHAIKASDNVDVNFSREAGTAIIGRNTAECLKLAIPELVIEEIPSRTVAPTPPAATVPPAPPFVPPSIPTTLEPEATDTDAPPPSIITPSVAARIAELETTPMQPVTEPVTAPEVPIATEPPTETATQPATATENTVVEGEVVEGEVVEDSSTLTQATATTQAAATTQPTVQTEPATQPAPPPTIPANIEPQTQTPARPTRARPVTPDAK